jgi:branched-chain amino acid transport system ATP-binding protein
MLELQDVDLHYGGIRALQSISLTVEAREIVCLIGANGAGKTSTLLAISGLVRPSAGQILFEGRSMTKTPPHVIVRMGISHVREGRRVFPGLSVEDNLELGAYSRSDASAVREDFERVFNLFPQLAERRRQLAATLSGGEQQMLAIGRALMARPRLLLLDEPSMGLAPFLVREIFRTIRRINQEGTTILLVEQDAHMALRLARRGYVLESGRITLHDQAVNLAHNEAVRKAYLGG